MNDLKPSSDAIEIALEKVLSSAAFRGRPRLRRLLTHLVQYSLAENGDPLKEYTLGVEVFDRGIRFDPQCDSIVRVEAFNLRKALRAYYRSEGATDLVTIGVPKGGYRATFRLNEEPPAAILDDPERLCCQVEWSLLRGSAHDIARIQRYVQHAIVRWPGRSDLHVALASTALAALELERVRPPTRLASCARQRTPRCSATRREAMRSSTPPFTGSWGRTRKRRSRRRIAGWISHQRARWHISGSALPWPRPAEWATPSSICSRPPGFSPTRPSFRPGSPSGCSVLVARTPACVTSAALLAFEPHDYLANFWLGLLASHARRFDEARDAAHRAYQVSGSTQALAALGYVEATSGSVESAEAILDSLAHSDNGYVARSGVCQIYVALGRLDRAAREWTLGSGRRRLGTGLGSARPALECLAGKSPGHLTAPRAARPECGHRCDPSNTT